ncbi:hypothetical protein Bca101_063798 [Brassica carinata]
MVKTVATMVEVMIVVKNHTIHNGGGGSTNNGNDGKNGGSTDGGMRLRHGHGMLKMRHVGYVVCHSTVVVQTANSLEMIAL